MNTPHRVPHLTTNQQQNPGGSSSKNQPGTPPRIRRRAFLAVAAGPRTPRRHTPLLTQAREVLQPLQAARPNDPRVAEALRRASRRIQHLLPRDQPEHQQAEGLRAGRPRRRGHGRHERRRSAAARATVARLRRHRRHVEAGPTAIRARRPFLTAASDFAPAGPVRSRCADRAAASPRRRPAQGAPPRRAGRRRDFSSFRRDEEFLAPIIGDIPYNVAARRDLMLRPGARSAIPPFGPLGQKLVHPAQRARRGRHGCHGFARHARHIDKGARAGQDRIPRPPIPSGIPASFGLADRTQPTRAPPPRLGTIGASPRSSGRRTAAPSSSRAITARRRFFLISSSAAWPSSSGTQDASTALRDALAPGGRSSVPARHRRNHQQLLSAAVLVPCSTTSADTGTRSSDVARARTAPQRIVAIARQDQHTTTKVYARRRTRRRARWIQSAPATTTAFRWPRPHSRRDKTGRSGRHSPSATIYSTESSPQEPQRSQH